MKRFEETAVKDIRKGDTVHLDDKWVEVLQNELQDPSTQIYHLIFTDAPDVIVYAKGDQNLKKLIK